MKAIYLLLFINYYLRAIGESRGETPAHKRGGRPDVLQGLSGGLGLTAQPEEGVDECLHNGRDC